MNYTDIKGLKAEIKAMDLIKDKIEEIRLDNNCDISTDVDNILKYKYRQCEDIISINCEKIREIKRKLLINDRIDELDNSDNVIYSINGLDLVYVIQNCFKDDEIDKIFSKYTNEDIIDIVSDNIMIDYMEIIETIIQDRLLDNIK